MLRGRVFDVVLALVVTLPALGGYRKRVSRMAPEYERQPVDWGQVQPTDA